MTDISFQLYSARNAGDFGETLKMLSEAGYSEVEGYSGVYGDPQATRDMMDANSITMPTGHHALEDIEDDASKVIALAASLGTQTIFAPYLAAEDRPDDRAGWEAFAKRLNEAGKPVREAGLGFGWHNHDFELVDLGGITPLDLIAQAAPDMALELDIGWVIRAGADPIRLIREYGNQISASHIKDIAPEGDATDEDGWADVGHGTVDWSPIHAALREAGVSRYVLEHDNPSDAQRFAKRSILTVKSF